MYYLHKLVEPARRQALHTSVDKGRGEMRGDTGEFNKGTQTLK